MYNYTRASNGHKHQHAGFFQGDSTSQAGIN